MYIRRKVYSVLTDDQGQEKLFSTNDIVLNDYEDYYVDDRLFADRERDWADAAIGAGVGLGAAGAGVGGYYGLGGLESMAKGRASKKLRKQINEVLGEAGAKTWKEELAKLGTAAERREAVVKKAQELLNKKVEGDAAKKINNLTEKEAQALIERIGKEGWAGKSKGWINDKIIGSKLFKGNKKAALAATLATGGVLGAGIGYAAGHKKK